jgi:ankyrin repeat protein
LALSEYLVEKRQANVNVEDVYDGRTPLMTAAEYGQLKICRFLIENGASLNVQDTYGGTAFLDAAMNGDLQICQLLKAKGADINIGDKNGENALHLAAQNDHENVCQYLIESGARLNERDNDGYTAMLHIYRLGNYHLLKRLCFAGAELPPKDKLYFNTIVPDDKQVALTRYVGNYPLRQTMIVVISAKMIKRLGEKASVKVLNVDLIFRLFVMLGGEEVHGPL